MIKKILLAIAIALPMCAVAQAPKFGIVNTQTIIEAMPEVKTAQETITAASKKYEDEFKVLQTEAEKKFTEYQALEQDAATPQSIKERRMQELQELDQRMQQFRQTATQDLQRQQEQLMAPIQEKVRTAINAVGAENSMTFIFENIVPIYVGTDVTDITAMVKTKLGIQ